MFHSIRPFFVALQFLTIVPLRLARSPTALEWGRSILYYPFVGFLVGGALLLVAWLASSVEIQLQAAIVLIVWVMLTGALHLDGLADTVDGFVGGRQNRERTLEIMKDPRCGAMGVTAVVLVLLLKFAALTSVLLSFPLGLFLAPTSGRALILVLFVTTPYVREQGLGADIAAYLPHLQTWMVVVAVCSLVVVVAGVPGIVSLIFCGVLFMGFRRLVVYRIGGGTGDTAGALVEISEACVLCLIAFVVRPL